MVTYHQQYSEIIKIPSKIAVSLVKLVTNKEDKDTNKDLANYIANWKPTQWGIPKEPGWRQ